MSETTEEFFVESFPSIWETGFELVLYRNGVVEESWPLRSPQLTLGGVGSDWIVDHQAPMAAWRFVHQAEKLQFVASKKSLSALLNSEKPVFFQEVIEGDQLDFERFSLRITKTAPIVAYLEGYTDPHRGQRWMIESGEVFLGRGAQVGGIDLEDTTVSRVHAKLIASTSQCVLQACSQKSETRVNSLSLTPNGQQRLQDGDLIWLGRQQLRFSLTAPLGSVDGGETLPDNSAKTAVSFFSLGRFRILIGGQEIEETQWQGAQVKYLVAYLCLNRRSSVSEDRLIQQLWGQEEVSRKRLLNMISLIRQLLRPACPHEDPVKKTPQGYQLNADLQAWHDLEELLELHTVESSRDAKQLSAQAERLFELHRHPYLEGCLLNFAEIRRAQLEQATVRSLATIGIALRQAGEIESAGRLALRILEREPLDQATWELLLGCLDQLGKRSEVLRYFEIGRKQLERAGLAVSEEMLRLAGLDKR
jgi:DNA-binding SARP family transcriptional activator